MTEAIRLFGLHGFDSVTMRQLGDAVDLDNSSLYRHFRNKAALVDVVLDRVAGDVFAAVTAEMDVTSPLTLKTLENICAAAGVYLFDHPASARLLVHWIMSTGGEDGAFKVSVSASDKSRPGGKMLSILRDRLDDAVRRGYIRKHATPDGLIIAVAATVIRPATCGYLFKSLEPDRRVGTARTAWERELRAVIRGAFAP